MTNLKLAFRTLLRTPFVTAIAVISLALGIGANAAIFSLFNQMLLRPLPVPHADQLVNLSAPGPKPGSQSCNQAGNCDVVFSYAMFRDLQRVQTVFTNIAAHRSFYANFASEGKTSVGLGMLVSGSYFQVLELAPAMGRLIDPRDDRAQGESHVAVLTYDYWQREFGQDPKILDKTIIVNGEHLTIVGVAPRGFDGTTLGNKPQVFVPITLRGLVQPGFTGFANRQSYWAYLFGRLRPGVSIEQARTALNGQYHAIVNDVEAPLQKGMSDQTMARFRAKQVLVEPGARGQSGLHKEAKAPLLLLFGITALVLVIACANIANLLLARAATRSGEMAIRLSIGAGRGHLIVQLLTESLLLAVLGGAVGILFSRWTLDLMAALMPAEAARTIDFRIDSTAMLFAAALTVATGILFGLFPALHSTRPDLVTTLKGEAGQRSGTVGAARFRTSLATIQIALSMALLVTAGLFTKSLVNVSRVELGLKPEGLVTFGISPDLNGYKPERARVLFERLEDELSSLPSVTSVTSALVPVIAGDNWGSDVQVEGFKAGPDTDTNARFNEVGPGFFHTMAIPVLAGREFTRADTLKGPKVVIVNEAFARKFNLGRNAVGKRMGMRNDKTLDTEIVGLVRDAKYSQVKGEIPPQFFRPYRQDEAIGSLNFYVRTAGDPDQLLPPVRKTIGALDPNLPVDNLRGMPQQIRENVFVDRMITVLSAGFAILATLLAAVGLYGVLAYTVAQRTREIGVRMALGAAPGRVRRMVLRQVGWMTLIGGAVGLAGAIALGIAAQSQLFELKGYDPSILLMAAVSLSFVAFAAGFIPAHRAAQIDPMLALRYE